MPGLIVVNDYIFGIMRVPMEESSKRRQVASGQAGASSGPERGSRGVPRIGEVAALAGVSVATVSRALANPEFVRAATRARVYSAVEQTGYVPNLTARNLRRRRVGSVLAIVPDGTNVFFPLVIRAIADVLDQQGFTLVVADTQNDPLREAKVAALAASGQVDGVLLLNGRLFGGLAELGAKGRGPAIVSLCESISGADLAHIETENEAAASAMTRYLLGLGHRSIVYLSGPADNVLEHARRAGFAQAMAEAGPAVQSNELPGDFTIGAGERAAQKLMAEARLPDAVFACNDAMAMGLIRAFAAAGIRVPQDVSVAGFDDIEFARAYNPGLTTMRQHRRAIGQRAAETLIGLIEGREPAERLVRFPAELVVRESTAPPARATPHT